MSKKLGIVIVNYNDYDMTSRLLEIIKNYKCLSQIVVVDNNSSDDSYKKLKKYSNNNISIIKNDNRHFASGLNKGAKFLIEKEEELNIIFSNSDIVIKCKEDLEKLSNEMKGDIVVVAPAVDEHGILNRGWKLPTVNQEILFNLPLISRYFKKKYLLYDDSEYQNKITEVDVVSGCFFMVDSNFLKEHDFFDENTFLYYEEQIFAKKVKDNNKKEIIDNEVVILHDHSISIDKSVKRINKHKILKQSQRYFAKECLGANSIQMFLLYLTDYFYRLVLYIRCLIGR